jgi:hypothetical protein
LHVVGGGRPQILRHLFDVFNLMSIVFPKAD